jgi:hypothetical protein
VVGAKPSWPLLLAHTTARLCCDKAVQGGAGP